MSVSIRLAKYGKRNAPSYRVVVTPTRSKRSGKNIAIIGNYNPANPTSEFTLDKEKYEHWVQNGAIVSQAVKNLVAGNYEFKKYEPKKSGEKKDESENQEQAEESQGEEQ
jgi:small subunit ribosomal protein S16